MKALTVKDLYYECQKEMVKGNGNKTIMISQDDEGNSYHYLWYSFQTVEEYEKPYEYRGKMYDGVEFYYANENVAKKQDTIILG